MATTTDLTFKRGDDVSKRIVFTLNGVALPVNSYILYFTIKELPGDLDADALILQKNTIPNDADATAGIYYWLLPHSLTGAANIVPGSYYYEFQLINPAGSTTVTSSQTGKAKILQDLTTTIATV